MIKFENDGEIDIRSIHTFGINVKETDNPIGFFGTGLKYAIAVLLRTEHKISIFSGMNVIDFSIKRENVRGKEFEFIQMSVNDEASFDVGFTTELGKNWDLWMAYRELACNMRDEDGEVHFICSNHTETEIFPESGKSKFLVTGTAFESIFSKRHAYLLEDEPDSKIGQIEIRNKPTESFFYRDVRVMGTEKPCLLTYNDLQSIELTEDRTVKEQHMVPIRIAWAYLGCHDKNLLRQVLSAPPEYFESILDFHGWSNNPPSPEFLEVVEELQSDKFAILNKTALKVWVESTQKTFTPKEIKLTAIQQITLEKAQDFSEKIGFMIRGSYPILVVESLGPGVLGLAKDGTIYIAERAFHLGGTKQVASTLIEEYLHMRQGWRDMSRELQSFLFDKIVSLGEELTGEPL